MYACLLVVLYSLVGLEVMKRLWFPLFYLAFIFPPPETLVALDRKSTRLNPVTNAHLVCRLLLEKKKKTTKTTHITLQIALKPLHQYTTQDINNIPNHIYRHIAHPTMQTY